MWIKYKKIRTDLQNQPGYKTPSVVTNGSKSDSLSTQLSEFEPTTEDELRNIIKQSPNKHCHLDPLPTCVFKECIDVLLPTIVNIINTSMSMGEVSESLKNAIITPLLKKPQLDPEILKNYRPVSNLSFLSKILEKVVAARLTKYLQSNKLGEILQSAYKKSHSTETALIRVQNDILLALDDRKVALLVLHSVLLTRMCNRLGITGTALSWFKSYLSNRSQSVKIGDTSSKSHVLEYGVPQGSVLGPILFTIYTTPLGDIIRQNDTDFHVYADDTQLYLSFQMSDINSSCSHMETCIAHVHNWMTDNLLKLNADKTELLLFGSRHNLSDLTIPTVQLQIDGNEITPATTARNLGTTLDMRMDMGNHVTQVCKSTYFHIRNISKIRKYLTDDSVKLLVHAFVTSRLDYGNSLLYGIPISSIRKLQQVQIVLLV